MNDKIAAIAAAMEKTIEELGRDIFVLAEMLDSRGNKGLYTHSIESIAKVEAIDVQTYFLKPECLSATEGILFHAEGRRKHESSGWMVRKNPHWKTVWCERYGETDPARRDAVLAEIEAKKKAEEEAKKLKRKKETFAQGYFEEFTTIQIAYRYAVADVLSKRVYGRYVSREFGDSKGIMAYLYNVYLEQMEVMKQELCYRIGGAAPDTYTHKSKKKMAAAIEDFAKANQFVEKVEAFGFVQFNTKDITGHFFTPEFVRLAIESVEDPDLRVNFEMLPKDVPEKTPVRFMNDREVVKDFMRFMAENSDQTTFEYEDTRLIMETLRKMYARVRGDREEATLSKVDGDELPEV